MHHNYQAQVPQPPEPMCHNPQSPRLMLPNIFLYFYDVSKNYIKSYMETSGRDYMSALCSYLLYPVLENKTEVQGTELGFAW